MRTNKMVDVSLVVANYNNGRYLEDFLDSVRTSTRLPREIIFVDDGSKDDSLSIARQAVHALPNMKIIALPVNVGFANALNVGIANASATFVMRMDPDDVLHAERIERQYDYITRHELDVVGSNAIMFHDSTNVVICQTNFPATHGEIERTILKGENGVLHATVLGRTTFFKRIPYIQENVPAEDYDIFARFLKLGARFGNVPEPLIRYRIHEKSASNSLKFSTIAKTYELRDTIFGVYTPRWRVVTYYWFIKSYRNYLASRSVISKCLWAGVSSVCYPKKLLRKITTTFILRPGR